MKTSMLEYSKTILEKVAFDNQLFWKEYHKSLQMLSPAESMHLRRWLVERFYPAGRGWKNLPDQPLHIAEPVPVRI